MFKSKLQLLPWVSSLLLYVFESLVLVTRSPLKSPRDLGYSDQRAKHALIKDKIPAVGFLFLRNKDVLG